MRLPSFLFIALVSTPLFAQAGTLPAAQLLPGDTLALICVPDWDAARTNWNASAQGKLWQDQALKPLRDKLAAKWQDESGPALERQLGIKWTEFLDLLHGQLTFALTRNTFGTDPNGRIGMVFLLDTKDKEQALKARLAEFKAKWVETGKQLKTDTIRDVHVTTLIIPSEAFAPSLSKALPGPARGPADDDTGPDDLEEASPKPFQGEVLVAQAGPLLILANNAKDIEKILARQAGGLVPALAEQGAYETNHNLLFRDAAAFAWVNFAPVFELIQKQMSGPTRAGSGESPFVLRIDRLLAAAGLNSINTLSARLSASPDGSLVEVFVSVPESKRRGLLNLLATDHKEAAPPPFVGSDVLQCKRWRLDGPKTWNALEHLMMNVSPEMAGLIQLALQTAGKERDPNFDLRRTLIGNLGDDFISMQRISPGSKAGPISSPQTLYLIGSPNAEQVVLGLKAGSALMPLAGGEPNVAEREFLGRKIYTLALAPVAVLGDEKRTVRERNLNFAATAGYAAISTDAGMLEEFLRAAEGNGKPLRDKPGLAEAAQKVGGMSTGFFGYDNQAESVRLWLENGKQGEGALDKLVSLAPLLGGFGTTSAERQKHGSWFDPALLPPFEKISKYFSFLVYSLSASNQGISWKLFLPTPPQAR